MYGSGKFMLRYCFSVFFVVSLRRGKYLSGNDGWWWWWWLVVMMMMVVMMMAIWMWWLMTAMHGRKSLKRERQRSGQTGKKDGGDRGGCPAFPPPRPQEGCLESLFLLFLLISSPATFFDPWWRCQRGLTSRKHCPEGGGGVDNAEESDDWGGSWQRCHLTKMPRAPPGQSEPPTIENPRPGRPGALWRGWWNTLGKFLSHFHSNEGDKLLLWWTGGLVGARRLVWLHSKIDILTLVPKCRFPLPRWKMWKMQQIGDFCQISQNLTLNKCETFNPQFCFGFDFRWLLS